MAISGAYDLVSHLEREASEMRFSPQFPKVCPREECSFVCREATSLYMAVNERPWQREQSQEVTLPLLARGIAENELPYYDSMSSLGRWKWVALENVTTITVPNHRWPSHSYLRVGG